MRSLLGGLVGVILTISMPAWAGGGKPFTSHPDTPADYAGSDGQFLMADELAKQLLFRKVLKFDDQDPSEPFMCMDLDEDDICEWEFRKDKLVGPGNMTPDGERGATFQRNSGSLPVPDAQSMTLGFIGTVLHTRSDQGSAVPVPAAPAADPPLGNLAIWGGDQTLVDGGPPSPERVHAGCAHIDRTIDDQADDPPNVWRAPDTISVQEVCCYVDVGAIFVRFNRDDGATSASIHSADLQCIGGLGESCSSVVTAPTMQAGTYIDINVTQVLGAVEHATFCVNYTYE